MKKLEKYFDHISKKDFRSDLEPMRQITAKLQDPQHHFPSIHIVGTNGKGSTAAFLSGLLQEAGYKVGLMTSPHLVDVRERIQINGETISWKTLEASVAEIESQLPEVGYLSFFEMITLVGFLYFSKRRVDWAVIEAGLGGRLDATNLLRPKIGVFTPISFDHEIYLGNTLSQITKEKCGILKPWMKVISAPQVPEVAAILQESCLKMNLHLQFANPEKVLAPLCLSGAYQKTNAAMALLAAEEILSPSKLEMIAPKALQQIKWPGRLQYLNHNNSILVDGAHNAAGIQALAHYLKETHPNTKIHFLLGVLAEKNWKTMFEPLVPLADQFTCLTPKTPRALQAEILANYLHSQYDVSCDVIPAKVGIQKYLQLLDPCFRRDDKTKRELLVATGSLYMIGDILQYVSSNKT